MSISTILSELTKELEPFGARLVAVSKTYSAAHVEEAMQAGQLDFGENKVQELCEKAEQLPSSLHWHQIGHLQSNKVKYLAPFVHLIHAVDSLKLLQEINKQASKQGRSIDCLLQMHIAQEETKFGLNEAEALEILNEQTLRQLPHVRLCGVMGMASLTEDTQQVTREFKGLRRFFERCQQLETVKNNFSIVSMGMSGDYKIALQEGSTMVRIGSRIFGSRK
ncbi:MAG: YggS family pyridoxal phosphate-dependent enzyme [Cytophagaceae bacterium]|jgi:hypothetical protein|nr:YggS family pyridoxal phosphate-dependent enzyme [Cytophagaceae bacterium]